ncbi:MAG: AraC family transcriptional regulator [Woeseiaceae bacterium]
MIAAAFVLLAGVTGASGQESGLRDEEAMLAASAASAAAEAQSRDRFVSLDKDVQSLKKEVLDLNRDLFLLEEELLFPANSQVAFFLSMDVGEYFELDSVSLKIDGKEVANYLYTEREVGALLRGGVHRVHMGNLKVGDHELIAVFTGKGPHVRDYRRGATMTFNKGIGAKYVELEITDRIQKQQPEFVIREWE